MNPEHCTHLAVMGLGHVGLSLKLEFDAQFGY